MHYCANRGHHWHLLKVTRFLTIALSPTVMDNGKMGVLCYPGMGDIINIIIAYMCGMSAAEAS